MNTILVYASQAKSSVELKNKYGKYNILESTSLDKVQLAEHYDNTKSLSRVYNNYIKNNDTTIVLVHDDVLIRDEQWIEKLENALNTYDVVGLAGASEAKIQPPCLWHIMCPRETHRGRVSHVNEDRSGTFVTNFGKQGRVLLLDGVFLAFKAKRIFEAGVNFDTTNPAGFHFYDIDFCMSCNSKKLKLGTTYIDVVHNSHGLRSYTDEWHSGQAWFMQKFADGKYNF